MEVTFITDLSDEVKIITDEYTAAARELNCDKDDIIKVLDIENYLPGDDAEEFEDLYVATFFNNTELVESTEEKFKYTDYQVRKLRNHKYIEIENFCMLWNIHELGEYLEEVREEIFNKWYDSYPQMVRYFYDLFSEI